MVSFGEKAKIKKAGNLNQYHSYVITTVQDEDNSLKLDRQRQSLNQVGGPRPFQTKGRVDAAHFLLLKCQSFKEKHFLLSRLVLTFLLTT